MKLLLVLFGIFAISSAAVFSSLPSTHPDHPGKCYFPEHKAAVKPGEAFNVPGQCSQLLCRGDFGYEGQSCGAVGVSPPCKLSSVDLSKPYPDCCPKPECPEQ